MFGNIKQTVRSAADMLNVFSRLSDKGEQERAKKEQEAKEINLAKDRAKGFVEDCSVLSVDGGTWQETYLNTTRIDSGEW